jgi:hypothetical protein
MPVTFASLESTSPRPTVPTKALVGLVPLVHTVVWARARPLLARSAHTALPSAAKHKASASRVLRVVIARKLDFRRCLDFVQVDLSALVDQLLLVQAMAQVWVGRVLQATTVLLARPFLLDVRVAHTASSLD